MTSASALPNPFVGRTHELQVLDTALDEASAGQGKLVLLAGEPGIGKTRLAMELCARARARQAAVVWGRCWEGEGAPAFWPWVQMVRQYMSGRAATELRADLGLAASDVARVVPDLGALLDDALFRSAPSGFAATPELERFRFFDGLCQFWLAASRRQPIVLVLDDLQWADNGSLRLWEFMAREMGAGALLMLALYREDEIGGYEGLRAALGAVLREPLCQRLALSGLADGEVARYVEVLSGRQLQPPLLTKLTQRTEGNPFFLGELVRLLAVRGFEAGPGWERALPIGVRHAVARRLAATSIECNRVLSFAAAIGQEFDLALLGAVTGDRDILRLLATLQPAEEAALIRRVDDAGSTYAFTHAMIQETLLANLTAAVRAWIHGRIAATLEDSFGHDSRHFGEMARHFIEAGEAGADKAQVYAHRAGDASLSALAYEEAVHWYEHALTLLERRGKPEPDTLGELLLALGDALMRAGLTEPARAMSFRAADVARGSGDVTRFARAALGFGWFFQASGVDHARLALLEEALAMLPPGDSPIKARVMARLAATLFWLPSAATRRVALGAEAIAIARRLGDAPSLAFALNANLFVLWEAQHAAARGRDSRELLALAESCGEHELTLQSRHWVVTSLLEACDLQGARREIAAYARLAHRLRQPLYLWFDATWRAMDAFLTGPLEHVEPLAEAALHLGERAEPDNAQQAYAALLFCLRREQGRIAEFLPMIEALVAQPEAPAGWRRALPTIYMELGRFDDAQRELDQLDFPTDVATDGQLSGLTITAEVAAALNRKEDCARCYAVLHPFADHGVVLGMGIAHFGSVARVLGLLATALERFDEAEQYFSDALAQHERMGARQLVARTQHDWAAMLVRRGAADERERAHALLAAASITARQLGLAALQARIEALLADVGSGRLAVGRAESDNREQGTENREPALGTGDSGPGTSLFCRRGDLWHIAFAGQRCELRDARGLQYIAYLLQRPGRELHATELVNASEGYQPSATATSIEPETTVSTDLGSPGGGIDATATTEYQRCVRELRAELAEAEHDNDLGRRALLREELGRLTEELAHAGRGRRTASHAERARVAVTKAMRAALARIARAHPALADHLNATIRTGYFCSYTPDQLLRLQWTTTRGTGEDER